MAFKKMNNLKRLIIESGSFTTGPKHLPNSLRVLEWWDYPSPSLPIDFHPKKLVKLELLELSFCNCENLIKIHESVGFLDKLKILYAGGYSKLMSFPPIKLTSLEELKLSYCGSLECFPEILGKMENVTSLDIKNTPIKEFPSSIQNLTQLQRIKLKNGGIIQLPSSIFGMKELRYFIVKKCEGLLLSKENEGEAQMTSMVFRNPIDFLDLSHSNISDEFLLRGLPLFANVKELHLRGDDFTILPACIKELHFLKEIYFKVCENLKKIRGIPPNLDILCRGLDLTLLPSCTKECRFLRKLFLSGCDNLKKIKGIPLSIEELDVECCISLKVIDFTPPPACTRECLILSTLNFDYCSDLEQIKGIPSNVGKFSAINCEYLTSEYRSMLLNKFRNKFPVISLSCVFAGLELYAGVWFTLIINGNKYLSPHIFLADLSSDLLCICDHIEELFYDLVLLENEWNHVVCTTSWVPQPIKQIGIHVLKQGSNMEDIQFTNPLLLKEKRDFHNLPTWGKKKRLVFVSSQNDF
ncbi:TMV resistance protein N [Glycine soja]|uniref:TMV resistance protein N n=1 Tax=Glycine soja TaxID=3848 RepID=A0A445G8V6_GLYSO|nr:TMV resistance protein N [Glycine soja]